MKNIIVKLSILLSLIIFIFSSCNNTLSGITDDDILFTTSDASRPNFIDVFSTISSDKYDKIDWFLPSGEQISQINSFTSYFPNKGEYKIRIRLTKRDKTVELVKKITIDTDDVYAVSGEKLVWHDEFDGYRLNEDWWTNEINLHVNNEWQEYTNGDNINVKDGLLTITAKKNGNGQKMGDYTSGRVKSQNKKEFTFGRMEIRAKLPDGRGTWPAIWMLASDIDTLGWPACGEIDIMEHVGFNPSSIHSSLHSLSSFGNTENSGKTKTESFDTDFHIYGMKWTTDKMDFYIDSPQNIFYTYEPKLKNNKTWPFDKPFFFILNIAIGGDWGGKEGVDDSIFPQSMCVDYVRVYQ